MTYRHMQREATRAHRLNNAVTAATTISNSTTETTLLQSRQTLKNVDYNVGLNFEIWLRGTLTTIDSATGNDLDIDVKYGSTSIAQLEANNLGTNASIIPWSFQFGGRIHTIGSSGKIVGQGWLFVGQSTIHVVSSNSIAAGTAVDLTAGATTHSKIVVTAQWGTANAQNVLNLYSGEMRFCRGVS